jgi:hypothetical protein
MTASCALFRILRFVLAAALFVTCLYWLYQWYQFPRDSMLVMGALLGFEALALAAWICPIEPHRLRVVARIIGAIIGATGALASMLLNELVMQGV